MTDNGNYILDCQTPPLRNPAETEQLLRSVPGVVGTGLFLGMAHTVLVGGDAGIEVRQRPSARGKA